MKKLLLVIILFLIVAFAAILVIWLLSSQQSIDNNPQSTKAIKEKDTEVIMSGDCKTVLNYLKCEYELFNYSYNNKKIIKHYNEMLAQGEKEGFTPLMIIPSRMLTESLGFYNHQKIIEDSKKIDVKKFISDRFKKSIEMYEDDEDIIGEFEKAEPNTDFAIDWGEEVIIAKIPTDKPWELAAWLPMGGFNECPTPEEQVAIFKYWNKKYRVVPAAVNYDTWVMALPKPSLSNTEAEILAKEHFAFCGDIFYEGITIRELASTLKNSTTWSFWWD